MTFAQPFREYEILDRVGAGAMGTVFKARHGKLGRIVALKVLRPSLARDKRYVDRLRREARIVAALNHPNIVTGYDLGEEGGYHYFVMEFVDGKTVYDELAVKRTYNEKDALSLIIQIARALEHAHARGFIHRDVKPKNIMITKDGMAKLADMGLAREASDAVAAAAEKGRAYGTPYYISPEQIRGIVDVDFRADIYSLGATMYHMVTGKVPFEGPSPSAIMHKHLKESLVPPDHLNSSLSTGLAEVVERMMAKDRAQRYASTTDLLVDLERVQRGEPPLQARSGYDDKLLKTLADGSEHSSPDLGSAQYLRQGAGSRSSLVLLVAVIVQAVLILILIAVLASR